MANPKEYGKLVEELTLAQLVRELNRCKTMLSIYGPKSPAGKGLSKRLIAIERRLEVNERDANADG